MSAGDSEYLMRSLQCQASSTQCVNCGSTAFQNERLRLRIITERDADHDVNNFDS